LLSQTSIISKTLAEIPYATLGIFKNERNHKEMRNMVSKRELYKRIKEPEKVEKGRKGRLITQRTIDMEHDILPGEEGKV